MSNKKYSGRATPYVSRDTGAFDAGERTPSWFNEYVKNLEKTSVKSRKDDYSLYDQINSILGNKSKYSTVEEAVLDMQKRTGLYDYLQAKKEAQQNSSISVELFSKVPLLKTYIDNYVEDRPGTSVDAVIHDLMKIPAIKEKLPEGDDVPEDVKRYINNKILETNLLHPNQNNENLDIGKADLSVDDNVSDDNDPFGGCEPAKG